MQGWYNTGDVCTITPTGVVSVVGRTKELIKYKDFQVSPVELEAHLNSHRLVGEGAVGPVWDEDLLTELPTAYVVLKGCFVEEKNRKRAMSWGRLRSMSKSGKDSKETPVNRSKTSTPDRIQEEDA